MRFYVCLCCLYLEVYLGRGTKSSTDHGLDVGGADDCGAEEAGADDCGAEEAGADDCGDEDDGAEVGAVVTGVVLADIRLLVKLLYSR